MPKPIQHGKRSTYLTKGCRCDLCRDASRNYDAQRRIASVNPDDVVTIEDRAKGITTIEQKQAKLASSQPAMPHTHLHDRT